MAAAARAFLALRPHAAALVELIQLGGWNLPCVRGAPPGAPAAGMLRRMGLSLTAEAAVSRVAALVRVAEGCWRTRQYDHYQKLVNGILP